VSRKSVLPVFEKDNGLLFYPVQYEGEELSKNIVYTAEAVNQQATQAVDYYLAQGKKKFYLLGSDYVYPQTTNLVLLEYLSRRACRSTTSAAASRRTNPARSSPPESTRPSAYRLPADHFGDQTVRRRRQGLRDQHAGTGDTNVPFFKEYAAAGLTARPARSCRSPSRRMSFRGLPAKQLVGQLGSWTTSSPSSRPRTRSSSPTSRLGSRRAPCPAS